MDATKHLKIEIHLYMQFFTYLIFAHLFIYIFNIYDS